MADQYGMDPDRIERLRSPDRFEYFDPDRIWDTLDPAPQSTLVDIGVGVGFVSLPFARRYPESTVIGFDILEGMVALLRDAIQEEGLEHHKAEHIEPGILPLPDASANFIVMAQVHQEVDEPAPLPAECKRVLKPGATIAIIDWKDEENGKSPPAGRRVPEARLRYELTEAGFSDITRHDIYDFHTFLSASA